MQNLVKVESQEIVKAQPLYIFACPNPFTLERKRIEIHDRRVSIREIIADLQPNRSYRKGAFVAVNGEKIAEEDWNYFYPAPGSVLDIRVVPKGPVIGIIVAVAAIAAQVGTVAGLTALGVGTTLAMIGGAVAALAVSVVGYIIMNAFIRPPSATPQTTRAELEQDTPTQYLTGARNSAVPYGVIPRVYGKIRMVPPLAATGYTELTNRTEAPFDYSGTTSVSKAYAYSTSYFNLTDWLGEDQYLNMALCWGYGPIALRGLRIATTDLEDFSSYTIEHRYGYPEDTPLTMYTNDVYEEALNIHLTKASGYQTRTTQKHCEEISIDIAFDGLYQVIPSTGQKSQLTVGFSIQYKEVGTPDTDPEWARNGTFIFNCTGSRMSTVRRGLNIPTDGGQYQVRIMRGTDDYDSQYIKGDAYWVVLRSIRHSRPVKETGVALTALRIKATDQLQGAVDELNGLVSSILLDWDISAQRWVERETNNPASIIRDILMGSANNRPLTSARVDLENLQAFHNWCSQKKFACNKIFDSSISIWDALQLVAACGRATLAMINGKWGVVIDKEQDIPTQHFTQRNTWDFRASQGFVEEIHGFRVKFLNEEEDYSETETTVYMDGYDESNATKFEDLQLDGVTNYDQVYSLARYFLAVGEHRRETATFTTDFEHVVCQRGDWIKFSHDVMLIGIQSGRIFGYDDNGTHYTHLILDETVEMTSSLSYNIRCRLSDGTSLLLSVVAIDGTTDELELTTPVLLSEDFPEIGDLYTFGESATETEDFIVKSIEPGPDMTATLECTLYASAVFTADEGPIPPYKPKITVPLEWQVPVINTIYSDGSVLIWSQGTWQSRVLVTFTFPAFIPNYTGIEGWFRKSAESGGGAWLSVTASLTEKELSLIPVEDGAEYEMKFRFVKADGTRGPWTAVYEHTVLGKTDPPSDVTGFVASYFGGLVTCNWDEVPDVDVSAYELRYGDIGVDWDDATVIIQALSSTSAITVMLPLGSWDVLIKALDVVGNYSVNAASSTIEVPSTYQTVFLQTHTGWPGSKTNFVEDLKTGHINPSSTAIATGANFNVFSSYVYNPATQSIYTGDYIALGQTEYITNAGAGDQTDWVDSNSDGTADNWTKIGGGTGSIVSGNGFGGRAQRLVAPGTPNSNYLGQSVSLTTGTQYHCFLKYRSSAVLRVAQYLNATTSFSANTGIAQSKYCSFTANSQTAFYIWTTPSGSWFEVDQVSIRPVQEDTIRAYASVRGVRGAGETGALVPTIQIDTGSGWQDWTIGNVTCSQIRFRFVTRATIGLYAISKFECYVDKEPLVETDEVYITSGSRRVTFTERFYVEPLIQVSAKSSGGIPRVASIGTVTTTTFDAHIHTTNGTATSGTITYTATSRGVL